MSSSRVPSAAGIGGLLPPVRELLPRGGTLPAAEWERRHRVLVGVLWFNAFGLFLFGLVVGGYGALHELAHGVPVAALAVLAGSRRFGRKLRSVFASTGLLSAAALLVHLTGGLIEAHFYFFVLIVALTVYEDWVPFISAVLYVLVHHGIVGMVEPQEVYNHVGARTHPWLWAAIHALFVALAGVAGIIAWRLNERVRERMRATNLAVERMAETDSLTGLANRRKAMADLERSFEPGTPPTVLILFDLDGFKAYNDSFGHPAGDALLTRLAQRLAAAVRGTGAAYRLGGDEFCVIAPGSERERPALERSGERALAEAGEAFQITASYGSVLIPAEAANASGAMHVADKRMYAAKNSTRSSALSQSKSVLLRALSEHHPEIGGHVGKVAELAEPLGWKLGMSDEEIEILHSAAELHDIGKVAIPHAIVGKPGPLDEEEWEFIRRHTAIGQRIVEAAPVLAGVGELIRSTHEAWNGSGYPDGLAGEAIPLGARIIAVCDAYDAMTSDRPYRRALPESEALAELRRCAGTQFDPSVVVAFARVLAERDDSRRAVSLLA